VRPAGAPHAPSTTAANVRRWCGALLRAAIALSGASARAQVAPPAVSQLVVDPQDARHLALRSNFGLMLSRDGGATWDWRGKAGMGYKGRAEPAVAILNGGKVVLGVSTGVITGDGAGCDFRPASGIDADVVDVVTMPGTRGGALAVSVSYASSTSQVWQSLDEARTFRALGATVPHFTALSLGTVATAPQRVYMTGLLWTRSVEGAFGVSEDGGRTFSITALAGSDSGSQPFIAAIHPKHPDTIYVRFTGVPGRLRTSDDAGRSFHEVLSVPGPLQGFAISPEGDRLFASSLEAGTYKADATSLRFERVACEGVPCLAAVGTALLGCGEHGRHGFVVGRSVDEGQTFGLLLDTLHLVPALCGASTSVGAVSARDWPRVAASLGQVDAGGDGKGAVAVTRPFNRACFGDARGADGHQGAVETAVKRAPPPNVPARGCDCAAARIRRSDLLWWGTALLLFPVMRERRRAAPRG
jgi:hypothetical protein